MDAERNIDLRAYANTPSRESVVVLLLSTAMELLFVEPAARAHSFSSHDLLPVFCFLNSFGCYIYPPFARLRDSFVERVDLSKDTYYSYK